jgi:hypothetical protein
MKYIAVTIAIMCLLSGTIVGTDIKPIENIEHHIKINSSQKDTYDLVVITPNQFFDALPPFQWHKEQHGISTIIVTLNDIYGGKYFDIMGRDDAEKVKYFIKNAYDEWSIKYVLIIGGRHGGLMYEEWWTPVRYSYLGVSSDWETRFLSDLYFADIYDKNGNFSTWDSNNNGIFGEWIGNTALDAPIDLIPDVYVGRWPARNAFEVEIMVSKTIYYENNAFGSEWFKKMVSIAGDTYPAVYNSEWIGNEGEEGTQRAINWMDGFSHEKLWASLGTFTGPDDVINAINQGCGFLFFDGHGSPMSWATHGPNSTEWIDGLDIWQMKSLKNDNMYPVCIVGGCHNSQFNISILNALKIYEGIDKWYEYLWKGETGPECWSWWLTRKIDGGSIATLGYSALGYTKEDKNFTGEASEWLDTHFFWEYGINGTDILGKVWGNVITDYLKTYPIDWNANVESPTAIDAKTAQEWILMGDPSLKIGGYPTE